MHQRANLLCARQTLRERDGVAIRLPGCRRWLRKARCSDPNTISGKQRPGPLRSIRASRRVDTHGRSSSFIQPRPTLMSENTVGRPIAPRPKSTPMHRCRSNKRRRMLRQPRLRWPPPGPRLFHGLFDAGPIRLTGVSRGGSAVNAKPSRPHGFKSFANLRGIVRSGSTGPQSHFGGDREMGRSTMVSPYSPSGPVHPSAQRQRKCWSQGLDTQN